MIVTFTFRAFSLRKSEVVSVPEQRLGNDTTNSNVKMVCFIGIPYWPIIANELTFGITRDFFNVG